MDRLDSHEQGDIGWTLLKRYLTNIFTKCVISPI